MNAICFENGEVMAYEQHAPFRLYQKENENNIAFSTTEDMITDAVERSLAAGSRIYVMVAWGKITGQWINPVGFLRVISGYRLEFSFFSRFGDDFHTHNRCQERGISQWEVEALNAVNHDLLHSQQSLTGRNWVVTMGASDGVSLAIQKLTKAVSI